MYERPTSRTVHPRRGDFKQPAPAAGTRPEAGSGEGSGASRLLALPNTQLNDRLGTPAATDPAPRSLDPDDYSVDGETKSTPAPSQAASTQRPRNRPQVADARHHDGKRDKAAAGSAPAVLDGWYGPARQGWLDAAKPWAKGMVGVTAAYVAHNQATGYELHNDDVWGQMTHAAVSLLGGAAVCVLLQQSEAPPPQIKGMTAAEALEATVLHAIRKPLTREALNQAMDKVRQAGQANPGLSGRQLADAIVRLGASGIPWRDVDQFVSPLPHAKPPQGIRALQSVLERLTALAQEGRCTWLEYTDALATLACQFNSRGPGHVPRDLAMALANNFIATIRYAETQAGKPLHRRGLGNARFLHHPAIHNKMLAWLVHNPRTSTSDDKRLPTALRDSPEHVQLVWQMVRKLSAPVKESEILGALGRVVQLQLAETLSGNLSPARVAQELRRFPAYVQAVVAAIDPDSPDVPMALIKFFAPLVAGGRFTPGQAMAVYAQALERFAPALTAEHAQAVVDALVPGDARAPARGEAIAVLKRVAAKCTTPALEVLLTNVPRDQEFSDLNPHPARDRAQAFVWLPDEDLAGQVPALRDVLQSVQDPLQQARGWVAAARALGRRPSTPAAVLGDGLLPPQALEGLISAVAAAPLAEGQLDERVALVAGLMQLAQGSATRGLLEHAWAVVATLPGLRPMAGESQDQREGRLHRLTQARIDIRDQMIRRLVPMQGEQIPRLQPAWLAKVPLPQPR